MKVFFPNKDNNLHSVYKNPFFTNAPSKNKINEVSIIKILFKIF